MIFRQSNKTITFIYPFGDHKGKERKIVNPYIFEIEGGFIIRTIQAISPSASQYDYFVNGELVTQRAGASEELLRLLIKYDVKAGEYQKFNQISEELKCN